LSNLFQARFHGRGGQGVVTAAEMLSIAAFLEQKHAQAFPMFGPDRMGAPVMSFCRISDHEIRSREPVLEPDALIVQDPTLLQTPNLFQGLSSHGIVLINSSKDLSELRIDLVLKRLPPGHVMAVPATEIALEHIKRPMPNAAMLGALAAMTGVVGIESVAKAIMENFKGNIANANVAAAKAAYEVILAKKSVNANKKEKRAC
jgi:pyruvate ferredoxin oxidoreductase gamma subunit